MSKEIITAENKFSNERIYDIFNEGKQQEDITELPRISIIHAAQLFEFPDGSTRKEFKGIILDTYRQNAWWASNEIVEGAIPECWALDYKTGPMKPDIGCELIQSDECAMCTQNEFGSDPSGGKGKACKNGRIIVVMIEGYYVPSLLQIAPTSLKAFEKYLNSFVVKHTPYQAVITNFQLDKKENYAVLKVSTDGGVESDINVLMHCKNIIIQYKDLMYRKPTQDIIMSEEANADANI